MAYDAKTFESRLEELGRDFRNADVNIFNEEDFSEPITDAEMWRDLILFIVNERLGADYNGELCEAELTQLLRHAELHNEEQWDAIGHARRLLIREEFKNLCQAMLGVSRDPDAMWQESDYDICWDKIVADYKDTPGFAKILNKGRERVLKPEDYPAPRDKS